MSGQNQKPRVWSARLFIGNKLRKHGLRKGEFDKRAGQCHAVASPATHPTRGVRRVHIPHLHLNETPNPPVYGRMDPLSFTASLIAVVGAAATAAKQLENLRTTLRDASSALSSLTNEISDLRIVLGACETAVQELYANSSEHDPPTALADVAGLFEKTTTLLEELDKAVGSCLKEESDDHGKAKVAKFKWLRQRRHVRTIQEKLRQSKQDILVLMESHSLSAISGMEVAIQQVNVGAEKYHSESTEKLDQIISTLSAQMGPLKSLASSTALINTKLERFSLTETNEPPHYQPNDDNPGAPNQGHMIQIRASCYRRSCRPWCSCRCHVRRSVRTPGLVKNFMGSLFLGYSGVPGITEPCNETQCRRRSSTRFILSYQFPSWFWTRALFASFVKSTMFGPEMLLRVQTTIPYTSETYNHCLKGNVGSLQRLFGEGSASPFDVDPDGVSLLHNALKFGQYQTCHLLISCGSDLYQEDHTGLSAFHYAWDSILLEPDNKPQKQALLEMFPVDEGGLDERQFTRIHKCVLGIIGSSLLDELNISTAHINDQDNTGRTALFWACSRGDEKSVRLLLLFGAKQISSGKIGAKDSPLHAASQAGHGKIARQLLLHGADVNLKGEADMTPLFYAVAKNDGNSCVDVLLEYGADVNSEDNEQRTPLLVATQNGELETSRKLLKHGARINHRAEDGWTPLSCCIFWNMQDSILLLLEWDADYTIKTDDEDTILHIAAQFADLDTLEVLRDAGLEGLSPESLNKSGKSAAEVAKGRVEEEAWHIAFQKLMESIREVPKSFERTQNPERLNKAEWNCKGHCEILERVVELSDTDSEELIFEDALENF